VCFIDSVEVPAVVQEWVKIHPVLAAIVAIVLLVAIVVFAVRYGDINERS